MFILEIKKIEFDPQPIRVDQVNIGILKPINPVSKSELRRRLEHSSAQRDRADLKKLHYDGARMYHISKNQKREKHKLSSV